MNDTVQNIIIGQIKYRLLLLHKNTKSTKVCTYTLFYSLNDLIHKNWLIRVIRFENQTTLVHDSDSQKRTTHKVIKN